MIKMLYEVDNLLELDVKEADFHITKTVNSPLEVKTATKKYKFDIFLSEFDQKEKLIRFTLHFLFEVMLNQ